MPTTTLAIDCKGANATFTNPNSNTQTPKFPNLIDGSGNWTQRNWTVYSTVNAYDVLGTGVLQNLSTTGNIYATRYEPNLVKLINALRADFNAPNAPFAVASIGFGGEPLSNKEDDFKQVYNALHPEFAGTVMSVDILKYWRTIAESPTNLDFHYNQSAETYMLVGDAMGRAMLEMQNDVSPPGP